MVSKEQVATMADHGMDWTSIGRSLHVSPGLAFMVATGLPADGSDVANGPSAPERSTQHLANPPVAVTHADPNTAAEVLGFVARRARCDASMAAAALARTAEPPPPVHTGDAERDEDVVTVLGRAHNQVKWLLKEVLAIPASAKGGTAADHSRRVSIVDMITERLSGHEAAEELVLWPAVRDTFDRGETLAATARDQENAGKALLDRLRHRRDPEEFDQLVEQLADALHRHVAFEDSLLLAVASCWSSDMRRAVGTRIGAATRHGPTRPHPHAPSGAAALHAMAPVAATVDRVRDAARQRPAARKGRAEPEAAASSRPGPPEVEETAPPPPGARTRPAPTSEEDGR